MKRLDLSKGLAASAVTALAVSGLTMAVPAPAVAAGSNVVFVSLHNAGHDGSVRYDGFDGSVTLTAMRLDPAATLSFQVNANPEAGDATPGWTDIAGSPTVTGDFARLSWTPDPALVGQTVAVRAVALVGGSSTYSTRQGVTIAKADWGTEAVAFSSSTTLGFFDQPYADSGRTATRVGLNGSTSATAGTARVGWWNPASQSFQGTVTAAVEATSLKLPPFPSSTYVPGGTFAADLDITAFDADAGDVLGVGVERDTDDVKAVTLYSQQIGSISAEAPTVAAGQPTTVTMTVEDTSGGVVAGAEVRRMGDGSLVGYTDGSGRVRDTAVGGALGDYYVNVTDTDAFEGGTDQSTSVTTYAQAASSVNAIGADGRVFDDDEYAAGDLRLQVLDQNGKPMSAGAPVSYRLYPSSSPPPAYEVANTDGQGQVVIPFAPQGPDGTYSLDYHVGSGSDLTYAFAAGDSTLSLTPASAASSAGGQVAVKGALTVGNLPLGGRRVQVVYKRGLELVPGQVADAGLVDGTSRVLGLTLTTDPAGGVSVTVDDPAEKPQGAETGGKLTLSTVASSSGSVTGNPAETATGTTAFGSKKGKVKLKLKGSSKGTKDKLVATGPDSVAGEKVKFYRLVNGKLELIKTKKLGKKGDKALKVKDANGGEATTYVVKLLSSDRVKGSKSKKLKLE